VFLSSFYKEYINFESVNSHNKIPTRRRTKGFQELFLQSNFATRTRTSFKLSGGVGADV
jgi:hypothetical protein